MTVDDKPMLVQITVLTAEHQRSQLQSVELPGDDRLHSISSPPDFFRTLALAIRTQASNCGSIRGVRSFRMGQKGKRIVYFASLTNRAQMQCESRLEAAHALAYEDCTLIQTYRCQPLRLYFDGWHYTPDALLLSPAGSYTLIEVKPAGKLKNPEVAARLAVIQRVLAEYQIPFEIRTEKSDRLLSAERTLIYARMHMHSDPALLRSYSRAFLAPSAASPLKVLHARAKAAGLPAGTIERLLWERMLHADGSVETPETTTVGVLAS